MRLQSDKGEVGWTQAAADAYNQRRSVGDERDDEQEGYKSDDEGTRLYSCVTLEHC